MRIENHASFWAAVLAFIGTIVIVMDSFAPIHRIVDQCPKWKNIRTAMVDLDTFDTNTKDGKKVGMVEYGKPGFADLVYVVSYNRPNLRNRSIIAIAKNQPIGVGGVPMKIVHILFKDNPQGYSLTTDYIFHEWVSDYRMRYFLKIGLSMIAVAFLLSVVAHVKWGSKRDTQQTHGEATSDSAPSAESEARHA